MLAITRYADENKLVLALTPSTDLGGSSVKRLQSFYRRFGLVPNRGRNKDFTTSESMIRRPRSLDVFDLSLPLDGNQVRETRVGHSRVVIDANANTGQITLASLRTPAARRGEGSARAALKLLLEQADRQGVHLTLACSALDGKTDQGRLHAFYRSMGFVDTGRKINAVGDPEMEREPNPVALPQDRAEPSPEKTNDLRQPLDIVVTREGWGEYIARVGDAVVGRAAPWVDGQGRFCMQNVAVSPLWRRRGVATALYQQVEADAGRALAPAISLSDEGFEFWKSFRPESVGTDLRHQRDELMGAKVMKKGRLATVVSVGSGTVTARYDDAVERANSETFLLARELADAIALARDHLHEQALAARLFAPGPQGVPGIVFHVTPAANKTAILAEGITPRLGDRSSVAGEAASVSFHFTSPGALLDAMDGWMADAFDQDEQLAVFAVNAGAGDWSQAPQAAYEATCSSVIPPGALELVSSDLGSLTALDARQALLEAAQRLQQRVEASQRRSLNLAAWAQGTAVKSEDGQPLVVFHSTVAEFDQFKRSRTDVGMHFGTAEQAAERFHLKIEADPYGPSLRGLTHATMPVYLRILRPLRLPDAGRWTRENLVAILPDEFTLEEKVAARTEAQVKRLIQAHGYDGIVYRNENEVEGLHQLRAAKNEAWSALYASQGDNATKDKDHPDYVAWDRARQAYIDFRKTHGVDSWIAFEPKQIKSAIGNDGRFSLSSADLRFSVARAFHGTPHRFERFSTDKVGSGEGAQTFGWGLYFAGKREVAEHYRKTISGDGFLVAGGAVFDPGSLQHLNVRVLAREGDLDRAMAKALEIAESDSPVAPLAKDDLHRLRDIQERGGITTNPGQLYEVEIPEEGRMLLWDKPLRAQPETVREALKRMALAIPARWETGAMGERRYVDLGRQIVLALDDNAITGGALYKRLALGAGDMMGDKAASELLHAQGIPGIQYLDGVSRGQGDGGYNYVVFSSDDVSIVDAVYSRGTLNAMPEDQAPGAQGDAQQGASKGNAVAKHSPEQPDQSAPDTGGAFNQQARGAFLQSSVPQTETPEFKRWFGDSKVVDAVGQPLVVYHGTAADFDSFDNAKTGANDRGLWGQGHYFAANPESANSYAMRQGDEARVVPAYVSIKNPLILKTGEDLVTRLPDGTNYRDLVGPDLDGKKIKDIAISGGHDGVVQIRPNGMIGDVVAYDAKQIKSAIGNVGTFDPENSDIRFSFAGARAQAAGDTRAPLTPQDLTATESFKNWFAGSKMLDEQGQPLVMYHGTNQDFTAFDRDMSREGDGIIFATPSQSMASAFAKYRSTWNGANVMPVYVRAEKVLEVQGDGRMIRDVERDARIDGMRYGEDLRAFAKREGYDAIMFRDVREDVGPDILPIASVYALLPTAQIKSATGNIGTFDPENSDIRFSFAGARAQVAGDTRAPLAPQDLTKTEGFGKWFGASKVVDAVGKPLVVYHGTQSEFTEFSAEFIGNGNGSGDWGDGFYFTDREDAAAQYAKGENGKVMPVYLAMRNPATNAVLMSKKVQDALDDDMGFESVDEVLSGMGYDGIAFTHKGGGTEYVVFHPEQIKSATDNDGEFDSGNADIRFSFAGPKSQLQLLRPLSEAVSRVESGQSAELVRRETGWFQGHDGQWRFELDDHGASLKNLRLDGGRGLRATSLSEILDHPVLFTAYPELRHLDVQITIAPEKAAEGRYQRRTPGDEKYFGLSPEVHAQGPDEATALSILLHEVQHVIQDIEGFAPGGNPQQFATTGVLPFDVLNASLAVQSFAAKTGVTVHEVQANPPRHLRDISYRAWQLSTEMSTPQLEEAYDQALLAHRPLESYRRLAGEVEARNTQVRRGWTAEQRLAVSPQTTEDVDAADVIVTAATDPAIVQLHVPAEVVTEDAGQELVANRRNRVDRGLRWDDLVAMDPALRVREARKDRIIPKPDYQALVDSVIHPMVAYVVKQAYDSISVQPNVRGAATDQDLQRYIQAANRYMDGVMNWANDQDKTRVWLSSVGTQAGAYLGASRGELTSIQSLAQRPAQSLLQTVYGDNWRAFRDEVMVLGGNKALGALQPAMSDAVKAMKEIDKGWPGKLEAWQKRGMRVIEPQTIDVDVHVQAEREDRDAYAYVMLTVRDGRQRVEVASMRIEGALNSQDPRVTAYVEQEMPKFDGKHLLVDKLRRFKGAFDSREAAVSHARDLTKVVRGGRTVDERGVSVEQAERVGVARRPDDRPVSSQDLIDTFGFRGINFGNWMKGDANVAERQLHLNHAYDSFMDLAEVLGVEPRAMSLGGTLGLAIGAQGNGGTYAAHFMPGVNEINITRTSGAGSLAHEWGHALDHLYARIAGLERQESPFLSEYIRSISSAPSRAALRDEVRTAYLDLMHHISKRPLTEEELAKTADLRVEKSRRNINSWLASIRRDFERSAAEALPNFDALAQRIRQDDFGTSGERDEFFPVITEIRQQYKQATGRIYSIQDSRALQTNLRHLRGLLESSRAAQAHSAQPMTSSHFVALAAGLDKEKGGKPYWATPRELFARAFDAWVSDQMELRETRNTYLSHADREGATVPMGDERTRINGAFSTLIQSVRTRQDDDGQVTLYSMPGKSSRSTERDVAARGGSGDVSPQFQYLAAEQALTRYQGCVQRFPKTVAAHLDLDGHFFAQVRLHGLDAHERSMEDLMGALALVQHPDAAERQSELSDVYRQAMDEELGELGAPDRQRWQSVLEDLGTLRNAVGASVEDLPQRFIQAKGFGDVPPGHVEVADGVDLSPVDVTQICA